jgi:hypothetical protein
VVRSTTLKISAPVRDVNGLRGLRPTRPLDIMRLSSVELERQSAKAFESAIDPTIEPTIGLPLS